MKRKINVTILLTVAIIVMVGCNSPKWILKRQNRHCLLCNSKDTATKINTVHDSTWVEKVTVQQDSAYYRLWLKCDSNGNVVIERQDQHQGNHVSASVNLHNNVLTGDCKIDSFSVYNTFKVRYEKSDSKTVRNIPVISHSLTSWQHFVQWWAYILTFLNVAVIVLKWLKKRYGILGWIKFL